MWKPTQLSRGMSLEAGTSGRRDEAMQVRRGRTGAAAMAMAIMLLLLTWWARGAADAAQSLTQATVLVPLPPDAWVPRWIVSETVRESGIIAGVGSGLIALAAFVRRSAGPGQRE
jgi:hypothetical protein